MDNSVRSDSWATPCFCWCIWWDWMEWLQGEGPWDTSWINLTTCFRRFRPPYQKFRGGDVSLLLNWSLVFVWNKRGRPGEKKLAHTWNFGSGLSERGFLGSRLFLCPSTASTWNSAANSGDFPCLCYALALWKAYPSWHVRTFLSQHGHKAHVFGLIPLYSWMEPIISIIRKLELKQIYVRYTDIWHFISPLDMLEWTT